MNVNIFGNVFKYYFQLPEITFYNNPIKIHLKQNGFSVKKYEFYGK